MPRARRQLAAAACAARAADPLPPEMPPSYLPTDLQQGPSGHTSQPKHGSPYATPYQQPQPCHCVLLSYCLQWTIYTVAQPLEGIYYAQSMPFAACGLVW